MEKVSSVKPEYVKPLLKLQTHEEFESLVATKDRLRAMDVIKDDDGTVDYSLTPEILAATRNNEHLRNVVLGRLLRLRETTM